MNSGFIPGSFNINMFLFSPLEQFEVTDLISFKINGVKWILFSNISLFISILFFLTFLLYIDFTRVKLIPSTFLKNAFISVLNFIESLLKENVTANHRFLQVYFP